MGRSPLGTIPAVAMARAWSCDSCSDGVALSLAEGIVEDGSETVGSGVPEPVIVKEGVGLGWLAFRLHPVDVAAIARTRTIMPATLSLEHAFGGILCPFLAGMRDSMRLLATVTALFSRRRRGSGIPYVSISAIHEITFCGVVDVVEFVTLDRVYPAACARIFAAERLYVIRPLSYR